MALRANRSRPTLGGGAPRWQDPPRAGSAAPIQTTAGAQRSHESQPQSGGCQPMCAACCSDLGATSASGGIAAATVCSSFNPVAGEQCNMLDGWGAVCSQCGAPAPAVCIPVGRTPRNHVPTIAEPPRTDTGRPQGVRAAPPQTAARIAAVARNQSQHGAAGHCGMVGAARCESAGTASLCESCPEESDSADAACWDIRSDQHTVQHAARMACSSGDSSPPLAQPISQPPPWGGYSRITPLERSFVSPTINEPELFWCIQCNTKLPKRFAMQHLTAVHCFAPADVAEWCVVADGTTIMRCGCTRLEVAFGRLPAKRQRPPAVMPRDDSLTPWIPPAAVATAALAIAAPSCASTATSAESSATPAPAPDPSQLLYYESMPRRSRMSLSADAKEYAVRHTIAKTRACGSRPSAHWYHTFLWRAGIADGKWDALTNPEVIRSHCKKEFARFDI